MQENLSMVCNILQKKLAKTGEIIQYQNWMPAENNQKREIVGLITDYKKWSTTQNMLSYDSTLKSYFVDLFTFLLTVCQSNNKLLFVT